MSSKDKAVVSADVVPEKLLVTHDNKRKQLVHYYMNEEKVPVSVSPFYAPYLGSNVMISVQGISVYVPADGAVYKIPKTHAAQLFDALARIDLRQRKLSRMSNIKENFEPSIGALRF
jgi:hypothetical protein